MLYAALVYKSVKAEKPFSDFYKNITSFKPSPPFQNPTIDPIYLLGKWVWSTHPGTSKVLTTARTCRGNQNQRSFYLLNSLLEKRCQAYLGAEDGAMVFGFENCFEYY